MNCRHCHWGDYPPGQFPKVALTECTCRCHRADEKSSPPVAALPAPKRNGKHGKHANGRRP